jgi:hypothetical protein
MRGVPTDDGGGYGLVVSVSVPAGSSSAGGSTDGVPIRYRVTPFKRVHDGSYLFDIAARRM